jgi:hypothetical protein
MTAAWDQRRGRRDPGVPTSPSLQTLFNLSFEAGKGELFSTFVQITRLPLLSITLAWVMHNSHGLTIQT